eukprot:scaffold13713_cov40-Phaeocystis_antarctica.AAC.1
MVFPQEELSADGNKARAHVHIAAEGERGRVFSLEGGLCRTNGAQVGRAAHENLEWRITGGFGVQHEDPATVHQNWLLAHVSRRFRRLCPVQTSARSLGAICGAEAHELVGIAPFKVVDCVVRGCKPQTHVGQQFLPHNLRVCAVERVHDETIPHRGSRRLLAGVRLDLKRLNLRETDAPAAHQRDGAHHHILSPFRIRRRELDL